MAATSSQVSVIRTSRAPSPTVEEGHASENVSQIGQGPVSPLPDEALATDELTVHDVDELIDQLSSTQADIDELSHRHAEIISKLRAVQKKINTALDEAAKEKNKPIESHIEKLLTEIKRLPGIAETQFDQIKNIASRL